MYLDFHGLTLPPFENTPDPRFFFASEQHREALANILYALRTRKGMVLISGDIGTGKTTVCHALRQRGQSVASVIVIRQAPRSGRQLLKQICHELALDVRPNADRMEMFNAIETELHALHARGRQAMLIIDEAQCLPSEVFDEVRLLSNLETSSSKLMFIVLMGQSELRGVIQSRRLEALRQRLVLAPHLQPLALEDTRKYLVHRLRIASRGGQPKVTFNEEAVKALQAYANGVPRLINVVADNCLLIAFVRSTHEVDRSIVTAVTDELVLGQKTDAGHVDMPAVKAA